MKLYIANCSKQTQQIMYRIPENRAPLMTPIDPGQQQYIGRAEMNRPEIDAIIDHLNIYGLMMAKDLDEFDGHKTVPLLASVDTPISMTIIRRVIDHNDGVLRWRGKQSRLEAAISVAQTAQMGTGNPDAPTTMELSVTEEKQGDHVGEPMAEGVRVTTQDFGGGNKGGGNRRRGKGQ